MSKDHWNETVEEAFRLTYADSYSKMLYLPYEEIKPALHFGWNHGMEAMADEYPNLTWDEVAEDLERAWQKKHPQTAWTEIEKHVRAAWEKARTDWQNLVHKTKASS